MTSAAQSNYAVTIFIFIAAASIITFFTTTEKHTQEVTFGVEQSTTKDTKYDTQANATKNNCSDAEISPFYTNILQSGCLTKLSSSTEKNQTPDDKLDEDILEKASRTELDILEKISTPITGHNVEQIGRMFTDAYTGCLFDGTNFLFLNTCEQISQRSAQRISELTAIANAGNPNAREFIVRISVAQLNASIHKNGTPSESTESNLALINAREKITMYRDANDMTRLTYQDFFPAAEKTQSPIDGTITDKSLP